MRDWSQTYEFEYCLDPRSVENVSDLGRLDSSKKYPSHLVLIFCLKIGPLPAILNATDVGIRHNPEVDLDGCLVATLSFHHHYYIQMPCSICGLPISSVTILVLDTVTYYMYSTSLSNHITSSHSST